MVLSDDPAGSGETTTDGSEEEGTTSAVTASSTNLDVDAGDIQSALAQTKARLRADAESVRAQEEGDASASAFEDEVGGAQAGAAWAKAVESHEGDEIIRDRAWDSSNGRQSDGQTNGTRGVGGDGAGGTTGRGRAPGGGMNSRRVAASRGDDDEGAALREVGLNKQKIKGGAKETRLGVGTESTGASGRVKKRGADVKGSSSGSKKKAAAESAKSGQQLSLDIDATGSSQTPGSPSRGGPSRDALSLPPSEWEPLDVLHASEVGIAAREGGQASEQDADSADDDGTADRAGGGSSDESSDSKAAMIYNDFDPEAGQVWEDGESVPFAHLASTLDAVQATSKRLEITAIMTNAFRRVIVKSPSDVVPMVHITLGRVAPAHEGLELGVGDGVLIQAIAKTMGVEDKRIKAEYKKTGDLATVAASAKGKQTTLARPKPLTVAGVFAALESCAAVQGKDSVKVRRDIICGLLMAARQNEALWIIRVLQGKLRAGLAEPTVVTALANAIVLSPPPASGQEVPREEERKGACSAAAEALKMALARLPCYKTVVPIIMEHPFAELATRCPLTPGVPVKAMLAHPSKGIPEVMKRFENQTVTCEYKYDGERAQVHILADGSVKLFSRNSEDSTGKFPDIVRLMPSTVKPSTHNGVIDCEVVAYDVAQARILPFQVNFDVHNRTYKCACICTHICIHICAQRERREGGGETETETETKTETETSDEGRCRPRLSPSERAKTSRQTRCRWQCACSHSTCSTSTAARCST